jgi:hypothetical protein
MKTKPIIAVLVAVVFLLSFVSLSFAKGTEKEGVIKGTVTKIEGNMVTVKDDAGKETTVDVKDVKDIKVGDKVKIKEGVIKKMTEKRKIRGN